MNRNTEINGRYGSLHAFMVDEVKKVLNEAENLSQLPSALDDLLGAYDLHLLKCLPLFEYAKEDSLFRTLFYVEGIDDPYEFLNVSDMQLKEIYKGCPYFAGCKYGRRLIEVAHSKYACWYGMEEPTLYDAVERVIWNVEEAIMGDEAEMDDDLKFLICIRDFDEFFIHQTMSIEQSVQFFDRAFKNFEFLMTGGLEFSCIERAGYFADFIKGYLNGVPIVNNPKKN